MDTLLLQNEAQTLCTPCLLTKRKAPPTQPDPNFLPQLATACFRDAGTAQAGCLGSPVRTVRSVGTVGVVFVGVGTVGVGHAGGDDANGTALRSPARSQTAS